MSLNADAYQGVLLGQKAQITSEVARLQNEIDTLSKQPQTMQIRRYLNSSSIDQEESLVTPRDAGGNYYTVDTVPSNAVNQIAVDKTNLAKYQDQLKTLGYQIDGQQQVIASQTSSKTASGFVTSTVSSLSTQAQKIFSSGSPLMLVALVIIGILVVGKL